MSGGLVGETFVKSSVVKDLVVVQTQARPMIVWWTLKWKIVCYSVAKYAEVDNVVVHMIV